MHKILVIEDNFLLLEMIKESLEVGGFYPIITNTYQEGYDLFTAEQPDLILCNYPFLEFNSLIILQKICHDAETLNIPLVFMLGYTIRAIPEWRFIREHPKILVKPFSSIILLEKIHTLLQMAQTPPIQDLVSNQVLDLRKNWNLVLNFE
ncbi:hypothetical protein LC613_33725 [Nostoc sphaeroides CHAB 2801]|uniref:response regulator n=1 Tax=Nostoc sphaeroides TaxID=446679 RepID=UPI001E63DFE4|nr:hypothetical protein [Nostoc sphaeroides]MCC5632573.1 hypothetical protein [Nostoc sphaeroides CHAB 2801]